MEEWSALNGYEGLYEASNLGKIRSLDRKDFYKGIKRIRKGKNISINYSGNYGRLHLSKNGIVKNYSIHRLIAQAFLGLDINNPRIKVLHDDDDPTNNNVNNLRLGTQLENIRDCISKNRRSKTFVFNRKLSTNDILLIKEKLKNKIKQKDIAIDFNISTATISGINKGKIWKNI